jgi:hypothetical protein
MPTRSQDLQLQIVKNSVSPLSYSFLLDSDATTNEGFTAMFGSLFVTGDDYRDTVCVDKKDVCVD